jgi:PadR family transcriptional regulator PadR
MRCMTLAEQDTRASQLLRGVLDVCLLAVIADAPTYGYAMTRRLHERGLSFVAEGSIYPVLGRLEKGALVETYREAGQGGPPRKYYRLTATGRDALARWTGDWYVARDAVDAVLSARDLHARRSGKHDLTEARS